VTVERGACSRGRESSHGHCLCVITSILTFSGFPGAQCTHANIYATQPLAIFGSDKQRSELIPKIINGEYRTCFGVTEPNAGLNTLDLTTTATRRPDGTWVSFCDKRLSRDTGSHLGGLEVQIDIP
jgi:alkylation response protein AidB-like acyl-CoA dehydrogenase